MIKFKQMGFKYPIKKNVGKDMMVQMFQKGIFKSNHLLLNELFEWRKMHVSSNNKSSHATLNCWKGNLLQIWAQIYGQSELAPTNAPVGHSVHGMDYIFSFDS
jgi:hypothetical protein